MKTETSVLDLRTLTMRLMRRENLERTEAASFLNALLSPTAKDPQIAAALALLAAKGETVEELAGMADAMRDRAIPVHSRHARLIDTAGTGSSRAKTFNVSTAAAFVIAGAGVPVAKHGSRAATSPCGSADVLEALGIRTTFNLLGPLTNPARAPFQIVGVWQHLLIERVASALSLLGVQNAWAVHGADGLDEITIANKTFVAACSANRSLETFTVSPQDFGLETQSLNGFVASGPKKNAQLIRSIFQGEKESATAAARDLVIINAAAALHVAGFTDDLYEAAIFAR